VGTACRCANLTLNPETTPLGTNWRSRLGAADRNTVGHCWQMAEALRFEPDFLNDDAIKFRFWRGKKL